MRRVVAAGVFNLIMFCSTLASADYVCSTTYIPGSIGLGTKGYVAFNLYSGVNCTGSFLGTKFLCSVGATSNSCVSNSAYWSNETAIVGIAQELRDATQQDQRVTVETATCLGGGSGCAVYVTFNTN